MKRKEMAALINSAGQLMDTFSHCDIENQETGEIVGTITRDTIRGMQTAMCVCMKLISGDVDMRNPLTLANEILNLYAVGAFHLNPEGYAETYFKLDDDKEGEEGAEGEATDD